VQVAFDECPTSPGQGAILRYLGTVLRTKNVPLGNRRPYRSLLMDQIGSPPTVAAIPYIPSESEDDFGRSKRQGSLRGGERC
jgi:hypothetical protein